MLGWKSHEKETEKWQQKQVSAVAEKPMRRDVSRPSHCTQTSHADFTGRYYTS